MKIFLGETSAIMHQTLLRLQTLIFIIKALHKKELLRLIAFSIVFMKVKRERGFHFYYWMEETRTCVGLVLFSGRK